MNTPKISAVLLAAGSSTRMGPVNKLLYQIEGKAMIRHTLEAILMTSVVEVIAVTGYQSTLVSNRLGVKDSRVSQIHNEQHQQGMATSIAAGIKACANGIGGFMICLGDMPYISANEYQVLIDRFRDLQSKKAIVVPRYQGQTGHPVIFGGHYRDQLSELLPGDHGARSIISSHHHKVIYYEMKQDHILKDIDRLDDVQNDQPW